MNPAPAAGPGAPAPRTPTHAPNGSATTILAGLACWIAISVGFLGLKLLMHERPQFVGPPLAATKAMLVQESPQIVTRKASDDVSVIKPAVAESADVHFHMHGRRDYRGLKTINDMAGQFRADYVLTNSNEEPLFVLFKCAHPQTESGSGQSLLANNLRLQASLPGTQENVTDAWLWTGTIPPRSAATLSLAYDVGSLRGVTYRVREQQGEPVKQLKVSLHRQDLESMRFDSGDGANLQSGNTVVWERRDFLPPDFFSAQIVESRNLFTSLAHLLEIGPLVCLLFLLAVLAAVLARQPLTVVQVLTISAGYALYFPLVLYLSSRFTFAVALSIAVVVPGALLANYARWQLGGRIGLLGAVVFLGLYQVFPTLAAFAGWNRGTVLLALGVVTLWVLINLQNQALRRNKATALLIATLTLPLAVSAQDKVQVLLPGELAGSFLARKESAPPALLSFEPAQYTIRHEPTHFRIEARVVCDVHRPGESPVLLFAAPVHLLNQTLDGGDIARMVSVSNRLSLYATKTGRVNLRCEYRVPIEYREGKRRGQIPLLLGPSGTARLESPRSDLVVLNGSVWSRQPSDQLVGYELGVAGEEVLQVEWPDQDNGAAVAAEGAKEFYGIGITRAQHLTVIHSDSTCTHFSEIEVPAQPAQEFRMKLPTGARLISASLNGTEIAAPTVENQLCAIRLQHREPAPTAQRLSFRIAYAPVKLGFVGTTELALPELSQTAGTLEWVLTLPSGFNAQIISSGLEHQKSPPDLTRFGDYGRILKAQPHTYLAKNLAPPGPVSLQLKYRQELPGIYQPLSEERR